MDLGIANYFKELFEEHYLRDPEISYFTKRSILMVL